MTHLSPEFTSVYGTIAAIVEAHPDSGYRPELGLKFLNADPRPAHPFRIQLSHNGEAGIEYVDGDDTPRTKLARISITGEMQTELAPGAGWHVFDLNVDGSIVQFYRGEERGELDDEQTATLAAWLEYNREPILSAKSR